MADDTNETQPQVDSKPIEENTETKLRDELNQALGKVEVLQGQQLAPVAQASQPAPQPEPAPREVPYPNADLAESNPAEYNRQGKDYLNAQIAKGVEEAVTTRATHDQQIKSFTNTQNYIQKNFGEELKKGMESPVVAEATRIYQEAGYNYATGTPEYLQTQKNVLDQAARVVAEKRLSEATSQSTDETNRVAAANDSMPSQSTVQKQNTDLPDLSDAESHYNQVWGIDAEKLRAAKSKLEYVK